MASAENVVNFVKRINVLINSIISLLKSTLPIIFVLFIILFVLTSDYSIRYLTRNMANATKQITRKFKSHGMNEVEVQGKVSLGVVSFKVKATDKK